MLKLWHTDSPLLLYRCGYSQLIFKKMENLKCINCENHAKYDMKTRKSIYRRHFAFAYVLCVAVIFCGCETTIKKTDMEERYNGFPVQSVVIDSCEYIYANLDIRSLTHKGNCKLCAERSKK